jgi:hypothetical protein
MRYTFSAEFLRVVSPATNFGESWELLCFTLLRAEGKQQLLRLSPPDRGVDILDSTRADAYQCKSSERGIFGTIDTADCLASMQTAIDARQSLGWTKYHLGIVSKLLLQVIKKWLALRHGRRPSQNCREVPIPAWRYG